MSISSNPRFVVQAAHAFHVVDTATGETVTGPKNEEDAEATATAKNQLDSLGIRAGDTVTGTTTGDHPRRITMTVDREPWTSGTHSAVLSNGRSVEAVLLVDLTVVHADHASEPPLPVAQIRERAYRSAQQTRELIDPTSPAWQAAQEELGRMLYLAKQYDPTYPTGADDADAIEHCTCVEFCDEDPWTGCDLAGTPHTHPRSQGPGFGPCPVHPERPGDH